jgi:hypothetical protein
MDSGYVGIATDLAAAPIQSQLILPVGIPLASHAGSLPEAVDADSCIWGSGKLSG